MENFSRNSPEILQKFSRKNLRKKILIKSDNKYNLSKNGKLIFRYIKESKKVTKKDIINNLGVTENQVKYALKVLQMQDKIKKIGERKNSCYIIKESEENKVE